jgi:predicted nucleic acid-binding protein
VIELIDTSAWAWRERDSDVRAEVDLLIESERAATSEPVVLELLYSARNLKDFRQIRARLGVLENCPVDPDAWTRALEVYESLAAQGGAHQRQVKHMNLLIAAAAETAGVGVLHCDEDFDRIAAVTGQPTRWAPRRRSAS